MADQHDGEKPLTYTCRHKKVVARRDVEGNWKLSTCVFCQLRFPKPTWYKEVRAAAKAQQKTAYHG